MSVSLGNRQHPGQPDPGRVEERERRRLERVRDRERLRRLNWRLFGPRQDAETGHWSQEHRIGSCGRPLGSRVTAAVADVDGEARGVLTGVETCGSPSLCLHCGTKIRARRAEQIGQVLRSHLDGGGNALFVTLTFSHNRQEAAADSFADAMTAWKAMTNSRRWRKLRHALGVVGMIRTTEVTHSPANGWHPHHHVALLTQVNLGHDDYDGGPLEHARRLVDGMWAHEVAKLGRYVHPSIGVTVVPIRDAAGIGAYVSKIECELIRSDIKRARSASRSSWQIALDAAQHGHPADVALWREFVAASAKHRYLSASPGLWNAFDVDDPDDDQIAEETPDATPVVFLDQAVYVTAAKSDGEPLAELRGLLESRAAPAVMAAVLTRRTGLACHLEYRPDDLGIPTITTDRAAGGPNRKDLP